MSRKLQFHPERTALRSAEQYSKLSNRAERTKKNVYGHFGKSVIEGLLDVPLPDAIVLDYLHVTLLGHAKVVTLAIYNQLRPAQRKQLNIDLNKQKFPRKQLNVTFFFLYLIAQFIFHLILLDFCNRKIKSIDNFAFVKGTEVRNLLFYGLLPHLNSLLPIDQYAHLAMYICSMRLLHSCDVLGDQTSVVADLLLAQFHEDHELFYTMSQSFKLHLHSHYAALYESHGSLSHLGCFGQESFIGTVSANYHGTRYYGDSICYYYNIDSSIQSKKGQSVTKNGPCDQSSMSARTFDHLTCFHRAECNCADIDRCCTVYLRFVIQDSMFHCLLYKKRQQSISYFVQYTMVNAPKIGLFGMVELFFTYKGMGYAIIRNHPSKDPYSNTFLRTSYYHSLETVIDRFYFILEKDHRQIHIVQTDRIISHCVIVEKPDYLFVSNVLAYDEHD
jgi:hypothetical protein